MSWITFYQIVEFFKDEPNCIKKGENAFNSKHVDWVGYNAEIKTLKGKVLASMKKVTYDVEVSF